MDQEKDILKKMKLKETGFKTPKDYLDSFSIDLPDKDSSLIPEENGFRVTKNYFDELNERIFVNLDSKIPKKTGFKVPDGYFKDLDIRPGSQNNNKVIQLFKGNRLKITGFSIAASILLLFSIYPLFDNSDPLDFNSLSNNDIENWLDIYPNEINSFELAEIIDDDDLYAAEMFSEQDISEYLLQTDIESWIPDN